jgi:hypothetical protein
MGRTHDLRDRQPHAERLPPLHPQSTPTARLLRLIRLRRPGVHFCLLGQIVPVAQWRAAVGAFSQSCHHVLGPGAGGELVEVRMEGSVAVET